MPSTELQRARRLMSAPAGPLYGFSTLASAEFARGERETAFLAADKQNRVIAQTLLHQHKAEIYLRINDEPKVITNGMSTVEKYCTSNLPARMGVAVGMCGKGKRGNPSPCDGKGRREREINLRRPTHISHMDAHAWG